MKHLLKFSRLFILPLLAISLFSCKDDDNDDPTPVTPPVVLDKNTSILLVNGLGESAKFSMDGESLGELSFKAYSKYQKVAEGTRTLNVEVGGVKKELSVSITKEQKYTVCVYGTKDNPKISVILDTLPAIKKETDGSFRYVNLYDSAQVSITAQFYFPSYKMYATMVGNLDNIASGKASKFFDYVAGVEANWRAIKAGTETSEPVPGYKVNPPASDVLYTSSEPAKGEVGKHTSIVVFYSGSQKGHAVIVHEAQ